MTSYCDIAPGHPFHGPYHEYGFPARRDSVLFDRLVLEINQAGLSWLTVLKKRAAFVAALDGFDIDRVAAYGARDRRRLLADAGIIRNRLKIEASHRKRTTTAADSPGARFLRRMARFSSSSAPGRLGEIVQEVPFVSPAARSSGSSC
jgi:DNA-3-methyladenine glycosylase I